MFPSLALAQATLTGVYPQAAFESQSLTDRSSIGVNVINGNLLVSASDLQIAGTGLDLAVGRTYNGLSQSSGSFGSRWNMGTGQDVRLYDGGSSVQLYGPSGEVLTFTYDSPSGTYNAPPGIHATLTRNEDFTPENPDCDYPPQPACFTYTFILSDHATGERLTFSSSGAGHWERLESQDDRRTNVISFAYTAGKLASIRDTQGRTLTATQDGAGRITRLTDVTQRSVAYAYDAQGRLASYTDGEGKATGYGYDSAGRLDSITTPAGRVTRFAYDAQGRTTSIIRTTDPAKTTGPTTTFTYATGAPCSSGESRTVIADPLAATSSGHTVTYCGDSLGRVVKTVDSAANTTTTTYTSGGDVASVKTPGGGVTNYAYDAQKRTLVCVQGGVTQIQNCQSTSGGIKTTIEYANTDFFTKYFPTRVTNPQGSVETYCYNGATPSCGYTGPTGTLASWSNGLTTQSTWRYSYDTKGNVTSETDATGAVTTYSYDSLGNLRMTTPPAGVGLGAWTITPDALSRPRVVTDGNGVAQTTTFDALDRSRVIAFAGGLSYGYDYDADGIQTRLSDADGSVTTYSPDPLGRLEREDFPGASNVYTYDAASNLKSITDGGGMTTYAYNGLNQLLSVTEPNDTQSTTFAYNADGDRTRMTYPSGVSVNWGYHTASGRIQSVNNMAPNGELLKGFTYDYVKNARDTEFAQTTTTTTMVDYDDGTGVIVKVPQVDTTVTTYDAFDRPVEAVTNGVHPSHYLFVLDGVGNRLSETINLTGPSGGTTTTWAYDSAGLPCWSAVGAPSGSTCAQRARTYHHDANGNQTDSTLLAVQYNAARQPTSIYSRAHFSTRNTVVYRGADQSELIRDSGLVVHNNILGVSAHGSNRYTLADDGTLISQRPSAPAGRRNYLVDGFASVVGLTDNSGALKVSYDYDPHGHAKNNAPTGDPNPFGAGSVLMQGIGNLGVACKAGASGPIRAGGKGIPPGRGGRAKAPGLRDPHEGRRIQPKPATKALPAARQVDAAWGAGVYKHGGLMSSIEHINYRHAFGSGFKNVSRFSEGTSVRQIKQYVDDALRYGDVQGGTINYNLGRTIGTDAAGNAVTGIRVHVRSGIIRTAYPVAR